MQLSKIFQDMKSTNIEEFLLFNNVYTKKLCIFAVRNKKYK